MEKTSMLWSTLDTTSLFALKFSMRSYCRLISAASSNRSSSASAIMRAFIFPSITPSIVIGVWQGRG